MQIEIIAIGSELLNAGRIDTNSIWIAERLAELGLEPSIKTCVGDGFESLKGCIANALERVERSGQSGLIITTGGLGPTFDDRTKEAFAEIFDAPMIEDVHVRSHIDSFFKARGRMATENNYKQTLIPQGAVALHNPLGTAPGVYWEAPPPYGGCRIVMLPGPPREMTGLWTSDIHSRLLCLSDGYVKTLRFVVSGVGESVLDERTRSLRERYASLDWTILAPRTHVEFLLRSKNISELEAARRDIEAELGNDLVCTGDGRPETVLLELLTARNETLALAESVSGGILASRLVDMSGASRAFVGGVVAYTPAAKTELVGVPAGFIASHGTVGEAITQEMAVRIRERLKTTWGLAITGNAGPTADENALDTDGSNQTGRCYITIAGADGVSCQTHNIHGDRADIQFRVTNWAIDMLRRILCKRNMSYELIAKP